MAVDTFDQISIVCGLIQQAAAQSRNQSHSPLVLAPGVSRRKHLEIKISEHIQGWLTAGDDAAEGHVLDIAGLCVQWLLAENPRHGTAVGDAIENYRLQQLSGCVS